jgi:tight adherence protein B
VNRRLTALLAVALGACVLAASASAAAFRITEAGASFPDRAYVLSLPSGMRLTTGQVGVDENGQAVNNLSVVPAGGPAVKAKDFGVVLVIDASTSMEGKPERAAFEAARAFAAQRKPQEQLAIITYNAAQTVVLPFTTDDARIDAALSKQPPFLFGTYMYDAVVRARDLLREAHITAGSIIVLSDGQEHPVTGDTGKHETEQTAAAAARAAHARVFTVGLRSRLSKLGTLQTLARDTRGRYAETSSLNELTSIYDRLGSQLASEYLIRYRSLAGPGKKIAVRVHVAGLQGVAGSGYETPSLQIAKASPKRPFHPSTAARLWRSPGTMLVIVLLAATLIGIGVLSLAGGPRQGTLRRRMAEFVSVPQVPTSRQRPSAVMTDRLLEGTESLFKGNTWWERFKWELRVAEVGMPAEQIAVLTVVGTIVTLLVVKFLSNSLIVAIALSAAVPYIVHWYLKRALARRRLRFAEQLPDNLQVLSSALRAGHSFVGALSVVVNDAPEPAKGEFSRVVADEQLGVPIEDALRVVVERMENRELEQVALVAALQRETGGNTAEVLDRVTDTIRERFELRRTVNTLTAQGRLSRWVLTLLPVSLLVIITLINPGYIDILYSSLAGRILLVFAGISVTAGSFVIKRIVNIKV